VNAILSNSPETKNFKREAVPKNYDTHEIAVGFYVPSFFTGRCPKGTARNSPWKSEILNKNPVRNRLPGFLSPAFDRLKYSIEGNPIHRVKCEAAPVSFVILLSASVVYALAIRRCRCSIAMFRSRGQDSR
jgi:hypothetical protein